MAAPSLPRTSPLLTQPSQQTTPQKRVSQITERENHRAMKKVKRESRERSVSSKKEKRHVNLPEAWEPKSWSFLRRERSFRLFFLYIKNREILQFLRYPVPRTCTEAVRTKRKCQENFVQVQGHATNLYGFLRALGITWVALLSWPRSRHLLSWCFFPIKNLLSWWLEA
jgi:hypothetical protein